MIQLGLIDIAYNEHNHLKITPYGRKILNERGEVLLARYTPMESRRGAARRKAEQEVPQLSPAEQLLESLKAVREKIARKEQVPPTSCLPTRHCSRWCVWSLPTWRLSQKWRA